MTHAAAMTARRDYNLDEVLAVIVRLWQHHGRPPTFAEIGGSLGYASRTSAKTYVDRLVTAGLLEIEVIDGVRTKSIWPVGMKARIREAIK